MVCGECKESHTKGSCPSQQGKPEGNDKRRYTVKIHINKSRRGKPTATVVTRDQSPCMPAPICGKPPELPPRLTKCDGSILKNNYRKIDNSCRTKHQSCGTEGSSTCHSKVHRDCQTISTQYAHCGQQTSICGESNNAATCTKDCQTELDHGWDAVGICHNRDTCTNACCFKGNTKDTDCQNKHPFPFAGRTPSGHLKIHPDMVSYENKEFGILVANHTCVRTTVKRLVSCEGVQGKTEVPVHIGPERFYSCHCSNDIVPNINHLQYRPIPAPRRCHHHQHVPPPLLPPLKPKYQDFRRNQDAPNIIPFGHHHHQQNHRIFDDIDSVLGMPRDQNSMRTQTVKSNEANDKLEKNVHPNQHQNQGHTQGWTYVNPFYDRRGGGGHENGSGGNSYRDTETQAGLSPSPFPDSPRTYNFSESESYKSTNKGDPRQADRYDYGSFLLLQHDLERTARNNNPATLKHQNARKQPRNFGDGMTQTYGFSPLGSTGSERESSNYDKRGTPNAPPFPRSQMSESADYDYPTPTELDDNTLREQDMTSHTYSDDDTTSLSTCSQGGSSCKTARTQIQRKQVDNRGKEKGTLKNAGMLGKLHYVVKGAVDPNQKIVVGDAVLAVQSVILEILPKAFDTSSQSQETQTLKLPEFKPIAIPEMIRHIYPEEGVGVGINKPKRHHHQHHHHYNSRGNEIPKGMADSVAKFPTSKERAEAIMSPKSQKYPFPLPSSPAKADLADKPYTDSDDKLVIPITPRNTLFEILDATVPQESSQALDESQPSKDIVSSKKDPPNEEESSQVKEPEPSNNIAEATLASTPTPEPKPRRYSAEKKRASLEQDYSPKNFPGKSGVLPNLDTLSGSILVLGGINPLVLCGPENSGRDVYMYTLDVNNWTHVGILPYSRAHCGAARVGNYVYLIGGVNPEEKDENGKSIPVKTNLRLNLRSGEWDEQAEFGKARSHFGCVAIGQQIYVIGGNEDSRVTPSCLVFNTADQSWKTIASLDRTRANMGIAVLGESIVVVGGSTKEAKKPILESVMKYEPSLDRWTPLKSLPYPRAFCSLTVVKEKMYVIGGAGLRDSSKRKNSSLPDILCFDNESGEWETFGALNTRRHGHSTEVIDDSIIIVGGVTSLTMGPLESVEILSTLSGETAEGKSMSSAKSGLSLVLLSSALGKY